MEVFFVFSNAFAVDEGAEANHAMPEACKVSQPGSDNDPKNLIDRHAEALSNYQRLEQQIQNTPDSDPNKGEISRQLEEARTLEAQLKSQIETTLGANCKPRKFETHSSSSNNL